MCRASVNCTGGPGDDLGVAASSSSCCLDNPRALGYNPLGTKECVACVGECQVLLDNKIATITFFLLH